MTHQIPDLVLSNGVKMPILGLGTWLTSDRAEAISAIKHAVRIGYRHIDTAASYENEDVIGEALAELFAEGVVTREDIFVTTKCFMGQLAPEDQEEAIRDSLAKLRLDYVDLYLAHMPGAFSRDLGVQRTDVTVEDIWRGIERFYDRKLARAIGISNFHPSQVERVLKIARVKPHNHQVELHLHLQQKKLRALCTQHNITLTAYSPIGSPGRFGTALPTGYRPFFPDVPPVLENELVQSLAKKHGKTPAQILLRHLAQNGIAAVPKSSNPKRIEENFNIWDFELSPDEIALLNAVPQHPRLFWQDFLVGHPEDPFADERATAPKK